MRNIGEAARAADLPTKTVRYYADVGLVAPRARSGSGYRLYSDEEIEKLVFIRRARRFGFSIEACRELLDLYADEDRASADVKRIASAHLSAIDAQMRELQALRDELGALVDACKGDERPSCPIIRGLSKNGGKKREPDRSQSGGPASRADRAR